jgi:glutamate formiminotransferase
VHPRVGALDVAPIVYLEAEDRGAACAEALVLADRLADELALPVFLYGELGGGRTRAELRRGGLPVLAERMRSGELAPDFGPRAPHPSAGAVLVAARPPLVAFNLVLESPAGVERAREIAALIREGGAEGLPGVRAIGLELERRGAAQVSTNIDDPARTTPAQVLGAVRRHAGVAEAELVGLAPEAALADWPAERELRGRATIEDALTALKPA